MKEANEQMANQNTRKCIPAIVMGVSVIIAAAAAAAPVIGSTFSFENSFSEEK